MKACFLLIAGLSLAIIGHTVTGTIDKIDKDQLQIKTEDGIVTLHVDERTIIRKDKILNGTSTLAVGDQIRASCYGDAPVTAATISTQVQFAGVIIESSPSHIKVMRDAAKDAAGMKTAVFVYLEPATRFGTNQKRAVVGERVHVAGWNAGDGVVDAEKIAIYDTDIPVHPPARP